MVFRNIKPNKFLFQFVFIVICIPLLLSMGNTPKEKVARKSKLIGVATFTDHIILNTIRDSFLAEMKVLGYTQENGWQFVVKSANAQPSQAAVVADELLNLNPVTIVSISTPSTKPVFEKNGGRIPHLYSAVSFPASIGITDNSKNTTGLSDGVDFPGSFNLVQEMVPGLKRLGMVYSHEPNAVTSKDQILGLCKKNNVTFIGQAVSSRDEVKTSIQDIATNRPDAIFVGADSVAVDQAPAIIEVATRAKIPVFAVDEGTVKLGAYAALSVNYVKMGKKTAQVLDEIIKKNSADNMPGIEYLGEDIVVNTKAAENIGKPIPEYFIAKAYKIYKE
ncbi:ABC transporter substrate-binding protein [Desulfotignum phosphitoxidans]|uniref:ABC-type transport system periplasmic component n=1 Tax=Desulfotignum phosphitoxidans DSM 13687 TaxID=1286635 RepID=S0FR62_9BACT|nr:ABC transporter substrate-binding protein [Desulfotignum phosphitoxidans]EMS77175.1 ABC-type transport system periplasmic component [Desulfotignum phosphitoxidans DSM 13687]